MDFKTETTLQRLSDTVWSIEQGFVRSFLIVGAEKALLLDTGAEPCDLPGILRSVTDREIILVQSHGDGDHTANSGLFSEIFAHPAETEVICRFRPELKDRLRPMKEGDAFDLGGFRLEVIEVPGHTPGSICLLDRVHRVLFSGDTISCEPVFLFGTHRNITRFRETLEKLKTLEGFDTIYPCHGPCPVSAEIIPDLAAAVDGTLDGSIKGTAMEGPPLPGGEKPLCYRSGVCGILYIP